MNSTAHFCPLCRHKHTDLIETLHSRADIPPAPTVRRHAMRQLFDLTIKEIARHASQNPGH
jgi:hypothetical protein